MPKKSIGDKAKEAAKKAKCTFVRKSQKRQKLLMEEYKDAKTTDKRKNEIVDILVKIGMCLDKCKLGCTDKETMKALVLGKLNKKKLQLKF